MSVYNTNQTLLQRIRNKDDNKSWEEFVTFYKRYIYVIIRNMNVSHHDAEDLSQKVLLKVLNGIHSFDHEPGRHHFRHWLHKVTRNTVYNYVDKKKRKLSVVVGAVESEETEYLNNISVPDIDSLADEEWKRYIFNYALEAIKNRFQENVIETFVMFLEGHNSREIAEKMNLAQNTVTVYRKRVKEELRKEIQKLNREHS